MKQDRKQDFAFPSKSAEPAKLLVLVININTFQVTFKNQEDMQNCLRCCLAGAEIVNFAGNHFWTLSIAIRNYFSACDIVTSFHRLTVFSTAIANQENAGGENQCLFSHV